MDCYHFAKSNLIKSHLPSITHITKKKIKKNCKFVCVCVCNLNKIVKELSSFDPIRRQLRVQFIRCVIEDMNDVRS